MRPAFLLGALLAACGDDGMVPTDGGGDAGGPRDGGTDAGADAGGNDGGVDAGGVDAGGDDAGMAAACAPGTRDGDPGGAVGEMTAGGVDYNVRTPPGYDATVAYPLVVVYSPAGVTDPVQTEAFTRLTTEAAARGYLIAYVNHITPRGDAEFRDAASVPGRIAMRWCVDEARIYLTGHSDGGSVATVIALYELADVAAIAPSAAGVSGRVLEGIDCPSPLPVMVLHSRNDALFPGFGAEAAAWWVMCNGCPAAGAPLTDGCVPYGPCTDGVEVQYCEGDGSHGTWPPLNASMFDFFARF